MATGAVGAVFFAVVQITAKRLRNRVLVRRGEPGYKDCVFVLSPFLLGFGLLGALAGAIAAAVTGAWWPASALAAAAPPALLAVVFVIVAAGQARGSPPV